MKKRLKAFYYAFNGLKVLLKEEVHARIHLFATFCVLILSTWFKISKYEWIMLIFCVGIVWLTEALNSAIENLTDLNTKEIHPLAKKAKDLGAAAVLIAAVTSCIIGIIIFTPYIFNV